MSTRFTLTPSDLTGARVGVWGHGLVGQSALRFLAGRVTSLSLMEGKPLTPEEHAKLTTQNITVWDETDIPAFFAAHDYVLPSPGIPLHAHLAHRAKLLTELDLFSLFFKRPVIAITGTFGKTTLTRMLAALLEQHGLRIAVGGNIGIPLLDLITQQNDYDYAILELSSFQLQYTQNFVPNVAIWTNFHPNHLDHHVDMDEYGTAKYQLLVRQTTRDHAILDHQVYTYLAQCHYTIPAQPQVIDTDGTDKQSDPSGHQSTWTAYEGTIRNTYLQTASPLPLHGFANNWLIAHALLSALELAPKDFYPLPPSPEHRLEWVATVNGVDFYNDSKSTIAETTLAAVNQLKNRPITLILGGLGKGIDRQPLITALKNKVKRIVLIGDEATLLAAHCTTADIPHSICGTLGELFTHVVPSAQPGEIILLSPAGSSYDQFDNFMHRGTIFKQLVYTWQERQAAAPTISTEQEA